MFKIHPITNLINILLFLLILIFIKNNIIIFTGMIFLLIVARKNLKLCVYLALTLMVLVINILCGKLIILGRIMAFIGYLFAMFVDYDRIDFIRVYDTLFSSTNYEKTEIFLKVLYYKEHFMNNFKTMTESTKKLGYRNNIDYYIFCINNANSLTKNSLNQIIDTYEKRFYFNGKRSKYKIVFSYIDVIMFLVHSVTLAIIIMLGV